MPAASSPPASTPAARPRPSARRRLSVGIAAAALVPATITASTAAAAAAPRTVAISPAGSVLVHARGNGHGHGMSQYGARGAAARGLNYRQILGFYYRHAALSKHHTRIRVKLSGYGRTTTVGSRPAVTLSGFARPLSRAPRAYRLVAGRGGTLVLESLPDRAHASWRILRRGLPNGSSFHRANWKPIRIWSPNGTSARYYGTLRAIRTTTGVTTVNNVSIDRYTAGVVPYEMPSSWQRAAVRAQSVAARTYGVYAVEHPRGATFDICDTTACQVYGGFQQRNARDRVTASDDLAVARATSNEILTYRGSPIFAQFSASNGGWESSGGEPYLGSRRDPFDSSAAAGNPYASITRRVSARSVASYFGLAKLTGITVTSRDGNGAWGGRVETVRLTGRGSHGRVRQVNVQGYDLEYAFGLGTTLFSVANG